MYIHFNGNPCGKNIGDCVIRAISIVTGMDRHKVYAGLCAFGYPCTIWGNSNRIWADFLQSLGYSYHRITIHQTVEEFAENHPRGRYRGEYSRDDAHDSMISDLREMMQEARDEHTRNRFKSFIRELENA